MGFWSEMQAKHQQKEQEREQKRRMEAQRERENTIQQNCRQGLYYELGIGRTKNPRSAIEFYRRAAADGDKTAELKHALMLLGSYTDWECAFNTLKKLSANEAEIKNYGVQTSVFLHVAGIFCAMDTDREKTENWRAAANFLDLLSQQGPDHGQKVEMWYQLGQCYTNKSDRKTGVECWKKAAQYSDGDALYQAGRVEEDKMKSALHAAAACRELCQRENDFTLYNTLQNAARKKAEDAAVVYRAAANRGSLAALAGLALAQCHEGPSEREKGVELIEKILNGVRRWDPDMENLEYLLWESQMRLGELNGARARALNEKRAECDFYFSHLQAAAPEHVKTAYTTAVDLVQQGRFEYAGRLLEKAAVGGYAPAQYLLANLVQEGLLPELRAENETPVWCKGNPFIALEWFRRALEQGYLEDSLINDQLVRAAAQYRPELYRDLPEKILPASSQRNVGFGFYWAASHLAKRQDAAKTSSQIKKAADLGDAVACYAVAMGLMKHHETHPSEEAFRESLGYLQRSADQFYPGAWYCFGCLLEKRQPELADLYFEVAALCGEKEAMKKMVQRCSASEETVWEQLYWMEKLAEQGDRAQLKALPEAHWKLEQTLAAEALDGAVQGLSVHDLQERVKMATCALDETGRMIFWQTCLEGRLENPANHPESPILAMQQEQRRLLYELIPIKGELIPRARIFEYPSRDVGKTDWYGRREKGEVQRFCKEHAIKNAKLVVNLSGAGAARQLLAGSFPEAILDDPQKYCRMEDVSAVLDELYQRKAAGPAKNI